MAAELAAAALQAAAVQAATGKKFFGTFNFFGSVIFYFEFKEKYATIRKIKFDSWRLQWKTIQILQKVM